MFVSVKGIYFNAVLLFGALAFAGCAPSEAAPKKRFKHKPATSQQTRAAEQLAQLAAPNVAFEGAVPRAAGELVRVFKRPITTGVIEAHEERLPDVVSRDERVALLQAQGWSLWPPNAAPELASALSHAHPGLSDCPFLMAVSDEPDDLFSEPQRTVTCFRTVENVEEALEREAVIRFHLGAALPCLELRSLTVREAASARIRDLKARCRQMGIAVLPKGSATEGSPAVTRRSKRNRTFTRRIHQ